MLWQCYFCLQPGIDWSSRTVWRLILLLSAGLAAAQDFREFEKRVTEFTLPNSLHFIVMERHDAPVISFHTYVGAGSVNDPQGQTGIAHMFEHMAFKGTESIGTRNWPEERKALEAVEQVYDELEAERRKGVKADASRISLLEAQLKMAIDRANAYVEANAFPRIIEQHGGVGLNAVTNLDSTEYFYSMPANRLELWFLLESQRFLNPVFREFYKERDVVMEEYRMRIESNPQGRLLQTFLGTAFLAHPYRRLGAGWPSDLQALTVEDARQFFELYYVPANLTIAIVGDVDPAAVRRLADRYFGPLPKRPLPPVIQTREPDQDGPKFAQVESPAQPVMYIGYKRPDQYHRDDPVLDVIAGLLGGGRTGVIYKEMVRDKRISLAAGAQATFPGGRFRNLFMFYFAPSAGNTVEENEKVFYALLDAFKAKPPDAQSLERVKTKIRAGLIRTLDSNTRLATLLASTHANYGDWRKLFTVLDDIDKVTVADVQRVAREYFIAKNRTVAHHIALKKEGKK
jgi:predicted Zn-dependent peptidase